MNEWFYNGEVCTSSVEGAYGFIYLISYIGKSTPEYPQGTIYVGKKAFSHSSKKRLSKKAKLLPENKGKRILKTSKDSGWRNYYGSSKELLEFIAKVGKDKFHRQILCFTQSKAESTYMELLWQTHLDVLRKPSFNGWVSGKVFKYQLNQ